MAFTKLSERLKSLPLVICGPIVRRVTKESVSVWIACQKEEELEMTIFDGTTITIVGRGTANTIKLGNNLHVAVITAEPASNLQKFQPNKIYGYNIFFKKSNSSNLLSKGILYNDENIEDRLHNITYKVFPFPTFCLPSDDLDNLKIVHGSCRKPHGGTIDALQGLDTMLEPFADDPKNRPQMLCLTGDQIYADDVENAMLYLLIDAGHALMGWDEILPKSIDQEKLKPGNRQEIIAKTGEDGVGLDDLTVDKKDGGSHLIFLSEYYMMYLFAWSPTLWPESKNLDGKDGMGNLEVHLKGEGINTKYFPDLVQFRSSLPFVQKALANISTYMIFDDHEITDDWFITAKWAKFSLTPGSLSRRMMQNGLSAFAVFQAWGNTPDLYKDNAKTNQSALLKLLEDAANKKNPKLIGIDLLLLPIFEENIPSSSKEDFSKSVGHRLKHQELTISWNFHIDFEKFRIIFLDTRTHRGYNKVGFIDIDKSGLFKPESKLEGYSALIRPEMVDEQLRLDKDRPIGGFDPVKKFLILISPAPLFGNVAVEGQQFQAKYTNAVQRRVRGKAPGMYHDDQEAWAFFPSAYEYFLSRLAIYGNVLILSGDVHYAFSVSVKPNPLSFWPPAKGRNINFVNLTSTALKNSGQNTHDVANDFPGDIILYAKIGVPLIGFLFFSTVGGIVSLLSLNRYQDQQKADSVMPSIDVMVFISEYLFAFRYPRDNRGLNQRFKPIAYSGTKQEKALKLKMDFHQNGHDPIVGKDNIGLIVFLNRGKKIQHQIWFAAGPKGKPDINEESKKVILPHTIHELDFLL